MLRARTHTRTHARRGWRGKQSGRNEQEATETEREGRGADGRGRTGGAGGGRPPRRRTRRGKKAEGCRRGEGGRRRGGGGSRRLRWGARRKWFSNLEQLLEVRAARGKDDLVRLESPAVAREGNVDEVLVISQRLELARDVRLKVIPPQAKLLLAIRHSLRTLDSPSTTPMITHVGANLEYHTPVGKT